MNINDEQQAALANQIAEWNVEISHLMEKQQAMVVAAQLLAQQINDLRKQCRLATLALRRQQAQQASYYYMWENIGDGG